MEKWLLNLRNWLCHKIFFLDSGCNSFPFNHSSPLYGNYSTWLQTLNFYTTDTQLIALFGKSLVAFYLLVVFCVFVHVMITYFINKDLWFKYFPPGDDPAKQSSGQGNFGPRLDLWRPFYILSKKKPKRMLPFVKGWHTGLSQSIFYYTFLSKYLSY